MIREYEFTNEFPGGMRVRDKQDRANYADGCYRVTMATRLLTLGAATIISCLLISIGLFQYRQAKGMANVVGSRIQHYSVQAMETEIMQYDKVKLSGSDVVNFYRRYLGENQEFDMLIEGEDGSMLQVDSKMGVSALTEPDSVLYCRPGDIFVCNVIRNRNGVLSTVEFRKE